MKELYLGMAVIALILIMLSANLDINYNHSNDTKKNNKNNVSINKLKNNRPVNIPSRQNLNNLYLKKYYNSSKNRYNPSNRFYY